MPPGPGCVRRVTAALALVAGTALPVSAQTGSQAAPAATSDRRGPRVMVGVEGQFGAPLRLAGGAALFVPLGGWRCGDGICLAPGVEAQAAAGLGGWRIGAGPAFRGLFGPTVLVTLTHTSTRPRGATPAATYVGVDASYMLLLVRMGVGFARRISEPAAGPDRTMFTWTVTAHVPLWPGF